LRTPRLGARAFIPLALAGAVLFTLAPTGAAPAAAAGPKTEAQQIIKIAKKQIGDPWRYGASGPSAFDCSGLVIYSFRKAGDLKAIGGGKIRSARALYKYFKAKGLADRKNPKPGDLVIWGGGTHVGIYIGKGKAISTLTKGVRIHKVHAVTAKFTAYLHTGMWKKATDGSTIGSAAKPPAPVTNAVQATTQPVRYITGSVNLRTGAGIENRRIAVLRDGTRVVVLGSAKDATGRTWINVRTGERVGWVARWLTTAG
jgi:hypothetical protein